MTENLKELRQRHAKGEITLAEQVEHIIQELENISYGFPEGPVKHRESHEAWMAAKKAEKDFYDSLKQEVMKKGVAGVFAILAIILGLAITGATHDLITYISETVAKGK